MVGLVLASTVEQIAFAAVCSLLNIAVGISAEAP